MAKPGIKTALAVGSIITALRTILGWIGEIQTAQSIASARGGIVNAIGVVLLSPYLGPAVVIAALYLYFYAERQRRQHGHEPVPDSRAGAHEQPLPSQSSTLAALQAAGVSFTGGDWQSGDARQLLDQTLPLQVQLSLVTNVGGTPGLLVKAVNIDKDTVQGATVIVTDIRRWDDALHEWVMTSDIYRNGVHFREMEIGTVTLHPGAVGATSVGMVRVENARLEIHGATKDDPQDKHRMHTGGVWRISYCVTGINGRRAIGTLCLSWKGQGTVPEPCACPPYSDHLKGAHPPIRPVRS